MMKIMLYLGRRNQIHEYKIGGNCLGLPVWKRIWEIVEDKEVKKIQQSDTIAKKEKSHSGVD